MTALLFIFTSVLVPCLSEKGIVHVVIIVVIIIVVLLLLLLSK